MLEYLKLFKAFLHIGLFTIGGGMASLPLIDRVIVEQHQWLSKNEFIDLITISEMTPGPIGLNAATFVGTKVAGFSGAIVATLGSILPSFIIVVILATIYYRYKDVNIIEGVLYGIKPAVVAMIASAAIGILFLALFQINFDVNTLIKQGFKVAFIDSDPQIIRFAVFAMYLFILRKFKINPILLIISGGVFGIVFL